MNCNICFDDINDHNNVKYRLNQDDLWYDVNCCDLCIKNLLNTLWNTYLNNIKSADCASSLKRLLKHGSPINLRCYDILDLSNSDDENKYKEIHELLINNEIISAKLEGSIIGDDRQKLFDDNCIMLKYLESLEGIQMVEKDTD